MDHSGLIKGIFACLLVFTVWGSSSCTTHTRPETRLPPRTILQSKLKPMTLTILAEQFLEWQKGYTIQIRDQEQGLLVTEWTSENPNDRHRITLRVSPDETGALLSAHVLHQILNGSQWVELPSGGFEEAQLLAELDTYVKNSGPGKNP